MAMATFIVIGRSQGCVSPWPILACPLTVCWLPFCWIVSGLVALSFADLTYRVTHLSFLYFLWLKMTTIQTALIESSLVEQSMKPFKSLYKQIWCMMCLSISQLDDSSILVQLLSWFHFSVSHSSKVFFALCKFYAWF